MNTRSLAVLYDKLTPLERLPLIMAAAARGDKVERDKLVRSAPRTVYRLPDHWGVASAFEFLAHVHFMKLLEITAVYFQAFGAVNGGKARQSEASAVGWDHLLATGYELNTYLAGWRAFCAGLKIDPEILWKRLPGYQIVKSAESLSAGCPDQGIPGAA